MNWFTSFDIPQSKSPFSYDSQILSIGSCFAQVMGERLQQRKFKSMVNPFSTLFNPISISKALLRSIKDGEANKGLFLKHQDQYLNFDYHSNLRSNTQEGLQNELRDVHSQVRDFLKSSTHLLLTFGSAWVYTHQGTNEIVANCHKQPSSLFSKRLLSLEELNLAMNDLIGELLKFNRDLKITVTVSPVRHTKDGIPENQLSKSTLRVLCANLRDKYDEVSYFPAYEIMMDELRDYRFYKSDRIHPSEEAENYIWQKWLKSNLSTTARPQMEQVEKILFDLAHRPFNPDSAAHQSFLAKLLDRMETLNGEIDFSNEIARVKEQLNS